MVNAFFFYRNSEQFNFQNVMLLPESVDVAKPKIQDLNQFSNIQDITSNVLRNNRKMREPKLDSEVDVLPTWKRFQKSLWVAFVPCITLAEQSCAL